MRKLCSNEKGSSFYSQKKSYAESYTYLAHKSLRYHSRNFKHLPNIFPSFDLQIDSSSTYLYICYIQWKSRSREFSSKIDNKANLIYRISTWTEITWRGCSWRRSCRWKQILPVISQRLGWCNKSEGLKAIISFHIIYY